MREIIDNLQLNGQMTFLHSWDSRKNNKKGKTTDTF